MIYLGFMYQCGDYVQKNIPMAREWYQKGADLGDKAAAHYLLNLK